MLNRRPKFSIKDQPDQKKFQKMLIWFLNNDPQVRTIKQPTLQALYRNGIRPKAGARNDPKDYSSTITDLTYWFALKMLLNLKLIRDFSKDEFTQFLDIYSDSTIETIQIIGKLSMKYDLDVKNININEINKIPEDQRITFMINYMDDCTLSAELRVMSWVYYCTFGSHYKNDSNWKPL